jgi:hypothetical protein
MSQPTLDNTETHSLPPLLALPRELRDAIYEIVAEYEIGYILQDGTVELRPPLARVNKQLQTEYRPVFEVHSHNLVTTVTDLDFLHLYAFEYDYAVENGLDTGAEFNVCCTRVSCGCDTDYCQNRPMAFEESGLPRLHIQINLKFTTALDIPRDHYDDIWSKIPDTLLPEYFDTTYVVNHQEDTAEVRRKIWSQLSPLIQ